MSVGGESAKKTKGRKKRQETCPCYSNKGSQERLSDEVTFE